jgi:nucleoside phosphorylase
MDADTPLVRPRRGRRAPQLGALALLVATQVDLDTLIPAAAAPITDRRVFISRLFQLRPDLCLVGPLIGAPYAVMLLETLVAWGAQEVFFLGWCGALAAELAIGDLIVPVAAVSDDGTSRHYGLAHGQRVEAHPGAVARLNEVLAAVGVQAQAATAWTTDGVFRETPGAIAQFVARGATVVEMELAALLSAGRHLGVPVAGLLIVSDLLSGPSWQPGFTRDAFLTGRRHAATAIRQLCRMS